MTTIQQVEFANGWPKVVRFSRLIAQLAASGEEAAYQTITTITDIYKTNGNTCTTHGHLADPIVFLATVEGESQFVFACPLCSDPRLREQWEVEATL